MNLKPLYDRVVVKPIEADEVSAGGIVIPDNAKEKPTKGEVVAIGEGKALDNGQLRAPKVKVGDQVIYGQYSGSAYKLEGVEYKRSEEHTSELQSLMRISYAVFCLKKNNKTHTS